MNSSSSYIHEHKDYKELLEITKTDTIAVIIYLHRSRSSKSGKIYTVTIRDT